MLIRKAYKYKLKVSPDIEQQLTVSSGHTRFLWNKVLEWNLARLEMKLPLIWYNEAAYWLTLWKSSEDFGFLKTCHSQVLQQKLKDLEKAFRDGFDKNQPLKRLPVFKKKHEANSFRYVQGFKIKNKQFYLPKIGWVGFFKSQAIIGNPKNVTISKQADGWYASVQVEQKMIIPQSNATSAIGLDLGVTQFVTTSNNNHIEPVNSGKYYASKLAKIQKHLAKKKKFSQNWRKQKAKIGKLHLKIKNSRHDFQHKTSTALSKNHAMIVIEKLKVLNMSKSAKGTLGQPGRNIKAKAGLNKAILDQGWSEFVKQLDYKMKWQGHHLYKVNPAYTSQQCNNCHNIDKGNRRSQSEFWCVACNHTANADVNAAKNILAAGLAVLACGETANAASTKQEP
jgi:putative transposase